jgi:hypothetical protein
MGRAVVISGIGAIGTRGVHLWFGVVGTKGSGVRNGRHRQDTEGNGDAAPTETASVCSCSGHPRVRLLALTAGPDWAASILPFSCHAREGTDGVGVLIPEQGTTLRTDMWAILASGGGLVRVLCT